jgi:hypothetical protein
MEQLKVAGVDLLKAMEQSDGELGLSETKDEEMMGLNPKVAKQIKMAREKGLNMGVCGNVKKQKKPTWGPVLVERKRRVQDQGGTIFEKAVNLKKKKNLEMVKGNKFAPLQLDALNDLSKDVNIKIGSNGHDRETIISDLIKVDQDRLNKFVCDNPEVVLPVSIDVELEGISHPVEGCDKPDLSSPASIKEPNTEALWTEVVRKGRNMTKSKSRNINIGDHDRCILKY